MNLPSRNTFTPGEGWHGKKLSDMSTTHIYFSMRKIYNAFVYLTNEKLRYAAFSKETIELEPLFVERIKQDPQKYLQTMKDFIDELKKRGDLDVRLKRQFLMIYGNIFTMSHVLYRRPEDEKDV